MLLSVCTLTQQGKNTAKDTQAIHRTLKFVTDEHLLWSSPRPSILVIGHSTEIDWAKALPKLVDTYDTTPQRDPKHGQKVSFALIGNPVMAKALPPREDGTLQRGKLTPLPPEKWTTWLEKKLSPALSIQTIDCTKLRPGKGNRHTMKTVHNRVLFHGTATVEDESHTLALLHQGVGRGKAYGCGLLIINPTEGPQQ